MSQFDYDLFVIGAGSGGVRAARMSAAFGARVAVAEHQALGGTCVNVGCVPKKLFVYGAQFAEEFADAAGYGWQLQPASFHWPTLRDNKTQEIQRLNGVYENLLRNAGVDILHGRAQVTGPQEVSLAGRRYSARYILLATGSKPYIPAFPGAEHCINSDQAFYLPTFPKRALVLGGGYIAVEFAGIFQALGAETQLLYRGPLFLRGFDAGVREFVRDEISQKGIGLHFNAQVQTITKTAAGDLQVRTQDGQQFNTDLVLAATGRTPNSAELGLTEVGVALGARGAVLVNDQYQTSVPSIYALGDLIDHVQLTPVAIAQAMCVAENLFNGGQRTLNYRNIPTAVFCQPNLATVGLSEEAALAEYGAIDIYETRFRPMKHTLSGREERTLMKLVVGRSDDRVLGAHMVGPDAGEIIQGLAVALQAGATKAQFDRTIGIHPTAAEEFVTLRTPSRRLPAETV